MKRWRLIVAVLAIALVAAACGNSGAPTSYEDNPNDDGIPQAQVNYMKGCREAGDEVLDERVSANLEAVCACGFAGIREALTFEEFKKLDDDLRGDINRDLTATVDAIMRACIQDEAGF